MVSGAPGPRAPMQPPQWVSSQVLLCRRCSHHQTTKIKQLAAFSPRDEVSGAWEGLGARAVEGRPLLTSARAGPVFRVCDLVISAATRFSLFLSRVTALGAPSLGASWKAQLVPVQRALSLGRGREGPRAPARGPVGPSCPCPSEPVSATGWRAVCPGVGGRCPGLQERRGDRCCPEAWC